MSDRTADMRHILSQVRLLTGGTMVEAEAPAPTQEPQEHFDWRSGGPSRTVKIGGATIIYGVLRDTAEVISLRVSTKSLGKGEARSAMEILCQEADRHGITLTLAASPLTKKTKLGRLVGFYQSLGFELTGRAINAAGEPEMRRAPKG